MRSFKQIADDLASRVPGELVAELQAHHDLSVRMVQTQAAFFAETLGWIGEELGDHAIGNALTHVGSLVWKKRYQDILAAGPDTVISFWKSIYTHGNADVEHMVTESCHELRIKTCPIGCALGTLQEMGGRSKSLAPWTGGSRGIPHYCGHCKINKEILPRSWGFREYRFEFGTFGDPGDSLLKSPCRFFVSRKELAS